MQVFNRKWRVNPDRINGSGVLLSSEEKEEMTQNQKVTFSTFLTR